MNKNYTLKELAEIGQMSAHMKLDGRSVMHVDLDDPYFEKDRPAREAFTKAVLDAIGYEFPKDAEREAFDDWSNAYCKDATTYYQILMFEAWKAGREELRKGFCSDQCEDTKTEPAWIPWNGDSTPIVGEETRYEVECRSGVRNILTRNDVRWSHNGSTGDIIAYRILD